MDARFQTVADLLRQAVEAHVFPAASVEVGRRDGVVWNAAFGGFTYDPYATITTPDTIFDLASLTKVLATTTLAMRAVDDGRIALDDRVSQWLPTWRGADRAEVTIRHLLTHSSGLTAYLPFYRDFTGRAEFEHAICSLPLEYRPDSQSIYSDLGFILLGFILEKAAARAKSYTGAAGSFDPAAALSEQFRHVASFITSEPIRFNPPRPWRARCAPTEIDEWRGRLLIGEVHDENCWALGGAAGHAGLFGTAAAVGAFARAAMHTIGGQPILANPETMRAFIAKQAVPGSSRALGWDTMLPSSSCGRLLSASAIGHTGFTGTSLWIDWERDLYVVLLTNRVHPTRANDGIKDVRVRVHEAIVRAVEMGEQ
jgi:CubicO group peptidase (beta-lactamase class C family)